MRRLLTIFFAVFSSLVAWGQSATVSGRVFDAESKEGIVGAVIEVTMPRDSLYRRHYTSGYGGYFKTPPMRNGRYKMTILFLGYADFSREFEVKGMPLDLGDMAMTQSAIEVATVVKEVVAPRARIEGDTLRYTASQFKVTTDAELETLLRKMPGISISNGSIEAQGEKVRQIYVDNKEFFGGNVQQVLQSIPAQVVETVEVYNRMSEVSQITGIDDGEGGKVINIVTRGSMSHSEFGKVHGAGGYGTDLTPHKGDFGSTLNPKFDNRYKGRYSAGGSVNIFRDDMRVSILALANNLNKQNLSDEGISMSGSTNRSNASSQFSVNRQSGVAESQMLAFNYTDRWGKRKRARFEGTAFLNHTAARNDYIIDRWYNAPAKADTIHYDQYSQPNNLTLRLRGRLEWRVAKRQRLYITPTYTFTKNMSLNGCDSTSLRLGPSGARYYPSSNDGGSRSHNINVYAQYYYKFLRQGRMFLLSATLAHHDGKDDRNYFSTSYAPNTPIADRKYYYSNRPSNNTTSTFRIQPIYRDRIGRYVTLNMYYNLQYQIRTREQFYYDTDDDYIVKDPTVYRAKSSSSYDGIHLFHEAAVGARYGKGRSWFSANLQYRNTLLSTTNLWKEKDDPSRTFKRRYNNYLYNVTLHMAINRNNTLRATASSKMRIPGLWSLNDMWNVGNSAYLSVGNPDLRPSQEHNFFVRYTNLSSKLGTTFMVMAKAMHLSHYIGSKIVYSPGRFKIDGSNYNPIQLTQQVNLDGYWTYQARMSLGVPFKAIRSNVNIELGANYSDIPTEIIDMEKVSLNELFDEDMHFIGRGDKVMMHNTNAYAQMTLGSNISENIDFTVTWRGTYSHNTSTLDILDNNYFMQYVRANVKAVLPLGFTITSSVNFTHFISFTNKFDDNFTLWNLSVGKKVLNNLGEVELCVNDVLNQNTSFGRNVWASYSQLRYNTVLGRTYLVRFTYNIRSLGGQARRRKSLDVPYDRLADVQDKLNALKF